MNQIHRNNVKLAALMLSLSCVMLSSCSQMSNIFAGSVVDPAFSAGGSPDLIGTEQALLHQTDSLEEILGRTNGGAEPQASGEQMKAVWISYLEFDRILKGKNEKVFSQHLTTIMRDLKQKGFDTIFVQVRSHGDAYYPSALFPWAQYASGKTGKACDFDPFALLIEAAQAQDVAVHAWVNLFRLMPEEALSSLSTDYKIRQWYDVDRKLDAPAPSSQMAKGKNGTWHLNPNHPEVQQLIIDGVNEILVGYDIQGVHVDDYFYDQVKPETFGDTEKQGRDAVSRLIQGIYAAVKEHDPQLSFGVSPAGNIKNGKPVSDDSQFTDLVRWTREDGYLDYVAPQIYWDDEDEVAPFRKMLDGWIFFMEDSDKDLYIGLAGYKFAGDERLAQQMTQLEEHQAVSGMIVFRYDDIAD